jgi:hypothetical protein
MTRQLAAHRDYSSIAICQTNTPATYQSTFGVFHGNATFVFISSSISYGTPNYEAYSESKYRFAVKKIV